MLPLIQNGYALSFFFGVYLALVVLFASWRAAIGSENVLATLQFGGLIGWSQTLLDLPVRVNRGWYDADTRVGEIFFLRYIT